VRDYTCEQIEKSLKSLLLPSSEPYSWDGNESFARMSFVLLPVVIGAQKSFLSPGVGGFE
jgi:hypothetical protein